MYLVNIESDNMEKYKQKIFCPECDSSEIEYFGTENYDYITYEFYTCMKCGCEFDRVITIRYEIKDT